MDTAVPHPNDAAELSAWAPLRNTAFRWLWTASFVANIGTWMQTVGAQWFLVQHRADSTTVAFVQAASSLPVLLLTIPAGVLAEFVDRRRMLIALQAFQAASAAVLATLTLTGRLNADLLLAFTFILGAGSAAQLPAYQAFIPALVPRTQLGAAASLSSIGVNLARAVGPAVAGALVTSLGVGGLFVLNAASFVVFALVLLARPSADRSDAHSAGFLAGLETGGRYVRNSPTVRRIFLRLVLFAAPANILWALLPLVAKQQLRMSAAGYGVLLGAAGVGAVLGALVLPRVRPHLGPTTILTASGVVYGAGMLVIAATRNAAVVVIALLPTGVAWIAVIAGLNASIQSFLPGWVRARALSIYQVVLFTTFAASATMWGIVAQHTGLAVSFSIAGALLILGAVIGRLWPLHTSTADERSPVAFWPDPEVSAADRDSSNPVEVIIDYVVDTDRVDAFLDAITGLRRSRLRTGANRWALYRDPGDATVFVEQFEVPSWQAHLEQHRDRLTGDDQDFQQRVADTARTVSPARHLTREK